MRTARVRTMTMTMRLIDGSRRRFPGRASGVSPRVQALAILGVTVLLLGCNTQASGPSTMTTANGSANGSAAAPGDGSLRLVRGAHPFARPEFDIGPLDPERRLTNLAVVFRLSPQQKIDRDALLVAQLDPASPSYHKWLTPDEYAARFGAKAADIARTRAWLAQQGLDVRSTSPLGARVNFAGRVADIQTAFRTEMHAYKVGNEVHYAMVTAPAIPPDLADIVLALHDTHDFYARPAQAWTTTVPDAVCPQGDPYCRASGVRGLLENPVGLAPRDWATIYDVIPLYAMGVGGSPLDGSGAAIAIVGRSQISMNDVSAFRSTYGLPAPNLREWLVPDTGVAAQGSTGSAMEAILDTEWSGGIAPGATIDYVFTGADDSNVTDAAFYAIEQNLAPILSESFGRCELDQTPSDADTLGVYGSAANLLDHVSGLFGRLGGNGLSR
jgi:subtilase family serine protease